MSCLPIGAIYCAVSVGHELRSFWKATAFTFVFRFLSAIVHFVEPNLSGGPPANAKSVLMSAFHIYTDAVIQSASIFGAKLKVWKRPEYNAKCLKVLIVFQCLDPVSVESKEACYAGEYSYFLGSNTLLGNDFHLDS